MLDTYDVALGLSHDVREPWPHDEVDNFLQGMS